MDDFDDPHREDRPLSTRSPRQARGAVTRLSRAAAAEQRRLIRRLEGLQRRHGELEQVLTALQRDISETCSRLRLLDELTGASAQPEAESSSNGGLAREYVRGSAIRQAAIRVALAQQLGGEPLHYTNWYDAFELAGYAIDGEDPRATFLTQLNRSPVVIRAGAPGTYMLDFASVDGLRARLADLNIELSRLHDGQQTIEAVATVRGRRKELVREIAATERALDEALDVLPELRLVNGGVAGP